MTPFEQIRLELEKASIEEKSIIKKYLQSSNPVPSTLNEKLRTAICSARMLAKTKEQMEILISAVDRPQAFSFNKKNLSQDFFISILENTSSASKKSISDAFKNEDTSKLNMQEKKLYAMIVFYLSLENNEKDRENVSKQLDITVDQLSKTIEKTIKEDQVIVPVEYFQPELPFGKNDDTLIPKIEIEKEPANALRHQKTFMISVSK